jgi:hypothetical protein
MKMNKENIEFRKKCQLYGNKISKLLKQGEKKEAKRLINDIERHLKEWENVVKSARFKVNILKSLFIKITVEERRFK